MKFSLPNPYADFTKPVGLRIAEALVSTIWVMFGWVGTFLALAIVANALDFQVGLLAHAILTTILVVVAIYLSIKVLQRLWGWSK